MLSVGQVTGRALRTLRKQINGKEDQTSVTRNSSIEQQVTVVSEPDERDAKARTEEQSPPALIKTKDKLGKE